MPMFSASMCSAKANKRLQILEVDICQSYSVFSTNFPLCVTYCTPPLQLHKETRWKHK